MIGGKLMDWKKIVDDLKARALSTTYEGERKSCLKKIDEILFKYNIEQNAKASKKELIIKIPIRRLREIFAETYFPWYLEENIVKNNETIYFGFSTYVLKYIAKEKIKYVNTDSSNKFLKYMKDIGEWALNEREYIKSMPRVLQSFYSWHYYIEIDIPFAIWCLPDYIVIDRCGCNKIKIIEYLKNEFENRKQDFLKKLNSGYYDRDIRELFDPKLLTS